ncbi:MAG: type II toxin-antitoxin system RatA family toxin [Gammaproteobacteria bacterium]|nr:type II toxin-antitoxin system RatA family toxin [Gammaproteobacteria bacterium]
MRFRDSRHLYLPQSRLFAVVADVERYPEFVPGWESARILKRDETGLTVEQQIGIGPVCKRFRSRATIEPQSRIRIASIDGPFRRLEIDWSIVREVDDRCTVDLAIDIEARGGIVGRIIETNFDSVARQLIPLFVDRAFRLGMGAPREVGPRPPP